MQHLYLVIYFNLLFRRDSCFVDTQSNELAFNLEFEIPRQTATKNFSILKKENMAETFLSAVKHNNEKRIQIPLFVDPNMHFSSPVEN